MTKTYEVRAVRWEHGWELHIDGVGVTQVRRLARAEQQVRDYLESWFEVDDLDAVIAVHPEVGGLEDQAAAVAARTRAAAEESKAAAAAARGVVAALRAAGVSVDDTATIMGVSKGRVSQLAHT